MDRTSGGEHETLAPVIPLFGGEAPTRPVTTDAVDTEATDDDASSPSADGEWHPMWAAEPTHDPFEPAGDGAAEAELSEKALLKKLRTRSLSVTEARAVLRGRSTDDATAQRILDSLEEYGYLDDAALADQLVHAAVDRKGQGRQVIAQTLAKRGIPRDVADLALAALPDDDAERALEFARTKARSLASLDRETALRRLVGQLARRGYGGSVAMTAARTALDEGGASTSSSSGVRFR
ncbi:MAG: regulatory protein RecX [Microbacterium sp.]